MLELNQSFMAWSYGIATAAFVAFAVQLAFSWRGNFRGSVVLAAIALSALWSGSALAFAFFQTNVLLVATGVFDVLRLGAWLLLLLSLLHLPRLSGDTASGALVAVLGGKYARLAALLVLASLVAQLVSKVGTSPSAADRQLAFGSFLGLTVCGLGLVEQLFRNIPAHARWGVKPLCLGLGSVFIFDLYLYADAFLFKDMDPDVWGARGIANALIIPFIAMSAARNREWTLDISVSRHVVFHSTTMLASGTYLLLIAGAGYYVRYFGGTWGRALQVAFLFAAMLVFVLLIFSGSLRSKLRVFLNKHFFSYRYDYREEWLKFTRALSSQDPQLNIHQLSIKALADLVESPGGALWLKDAQGRLAPVARLNVPDLRFEESQDGAFARFLGESGWVVNLDEYRATPELYRDMALPAWLAEAPNAWLVVPLLTLDEVLGFVVLATPRARLDVNWEVLDLLKTAGRQAASFLAQMRAAEALLESKKFDAFNRMSAFVVHDIKNLVAQLSLLLKNAERHRDNPEFQEDMLSTIDHVAERMKRLLLQLRAGTEPIDKPRLVDLVPVVRRIQQAKITQRPAVEVEAGQELLALCHAERIERVIGHLVQNALDACAEDGRVWVHLAQQDGYAVVEVGDTGHGMSPEFLRERLFKPFQTTKQAGMGIGAYESHQYVTELGGKINVQSELNIGTRVQLLLPGHRSPAVSITEDREVA